LDITRANEIAIENSLTDKVTAVVVILMVFGDTPNNSRNANPGKSLNSLTAIGGHDRQLFDKLLW